MKMLLNPTHFAVLFLSIGIFASGAIISRSLDCDGNDPESRYQLATGGTFNGYVYPLKSTVDVETFYGYGLQKYSTNSDYALPNGSVVLIHEDTTTGKHSLVFINGPLQLEDGEEYADWNEFSLNVGNMPEDYELAVADDLCCDTFDPVSPTEISVHWTWKSPYTDGMALRFPDGNFQVDIGVNRNDRASKWVFSSGDLGNIYNQVTYQNSAGTNLQMSHEYYCPTPTPTPVPTPVPCGEGMVETYNYIISSDGYEDFTIEVTATDQDVKDFYNYGSVLINGPMGPLDTDGHSSIFVHRNILTGEHSLIIVHGNPSVEDEYVNLNAQISGLPLTFRIAVEDDPSDMFGWDNSLGVMEATWSWISPYKDGVAVLVPQRNLDVTIKTTLTSRAAPWKFFSAGEKVEGRSIDNPAGTDLRIRYNQMCVPAPEATPTPVPTPFYCDEDERTWWKYKVWVPETDESYLVKPHRSNIDIHTFYDPLDPSRILGKLEPTNSTVLLPYYDKVNDKHYVTFVFGEPLDENGNGLTSDFTEWGVTVDFLPEGTSIAVKDASSDEMSLAEGTLQSSFNLKSPNMDGFVLELPSYDYCIRFTITDNTHPGKTFLKSHWNIRTNGKISNEEGTVFWMCYSPLCVELPADDTDTDPVVTPVPTPGSVSCENPEVTQYRIYSSDSEAEDVDMDPFESTDSIDTFYGYDATGSDIADIIDIHNSTSAMMYHDANLDLYYLILYIGNPINPDGSDFTSDFAYYDFKISDLPLSSVVAVRDDPGSGDVTEYDGAENVLSMSGRWKGPYADGIAIRVEKSFCATVEVVVNTWASTWKFLSGGAAEAKSTEYSNDVGTKFRICYNPHCPI